MLFLKNFITKLVATESVCQLFNLFHDKIAVNSHDLPDDRIEHVFLVALLNYDFKTELIQRVAYSQ